MGSSTCPLRIAYKWRSTWTTYQSGDRALPDPDAAYQRTLAVRFISERLAFLVLLTCPDRPFWFSRCAFIHLSIF